MARKRDPVGKNIAALFRYGRAFIESEMKPHGISRGQFPFLSMLLLDDGCSQDELSERLLIDKTLTARALSKLERQGFVERRVDAHDNRVKRTYVTDKTRGLEDAIFAGPRKWNQVLVRGFSAEEKAAARDMLERMTQNAQREMQRRAARKGAEESCGK